MVIPDRYYFRNVKNASMKKFSILNFSSWKVSTLPTWGHRMYMKKKWKLLEIGYKPNTKKKEENEKKNTLYILYVIKCKMLLFPTHLDELLPFIKTTLKFPFLRKKIF